MTEPQDPSRPPARRELTVARLARDVLLPPYRPIAVRRFAGTRAFEEAYDEPLRVVHITDQHFGRATPHAVQLQAAEIAQRAEPDLVVLTGDYVAHSLAHLDELAEVLAKIDAPMVATMGNHDHWSGPDEVRAQLRRSGVEILDNANTVLELDDGRRIQLVGIDDSYTGNEDIAAAVKGMRSDIPTLGLSHIAEEADELWEHGISLVLSGHTHSGQVTLGGLNEWAMGTLGGHRYIHGLYGSRRGERHPGAVYVSAGIGAAVVGVRLGERARREIAVFELGVPVGSIDEHHDEQEPVTEGHVPASRRERWRKQSERKRRKRELRGGH